MIKCTNPGCDSLITVPEGALQVICGLCNTWHFPSDESNEAESARYSPSSEDYGTPYISQDRHSIDEFTPEPAPPPVPQNPEGPMFGEPRLQEINSAPSISAYLMTDTGIRLALKEGPNIIGRKNTDLVIQDRTVSRRHCVVEVSVDPSGDWEYFIYDIGHMEGKSSTNGVFVSGRSLRLQDYERIPIYHGSSFRIGNVDLVLQTN